MKRIFSITFLVMLLALVSCTTTSYVADYKMKADVKENVSNISTSCSDLSFSDSLISITWDPTAKGFNFTLTNKSESSLKILWDDVSFVSFKGSSSKIMHNGIKFIDRNNEMAPTTIISGSSLSDMIVPTDNVYWTDGTYSKYGSTPGKWNVYNIFPTDSRDSVALVQLINSYSKSDIKILMPIKYKDTAYEYLFVFKIEDANIIPTTVRDDAKTMMLSTTLGIAAGLGLVFLLL